MRSVALSRGFKHERRPEKDFWDTLYGEGSPLGRRRRSILLIIIAVGILTFFAPLITTDPPVLGRTQWSVFELSLHVYQRELPPSRQWAIDPVMLPPDPVVLYSLLLCLLAILRFPGLHRHLAAIAVIGIFVNGEMWKFQGVDFERTFYGHASYDPNLSLSRHVGFGQLVLALLAVFGSVLFVAVHEDLDQESSQEEVEVGDGERDIRGQEFLNAEIIPPEETTAPKILDAEILPPEKAAKRLCDPRRLHD